jgi:hypothetical protein
LTLRTEEDPTVVIDELVALANEVPRANLRRQEFALKTGPNGEAETQR